MVKEKGFPPLMVGEGDGDIFGEGGPDVARKEKTKGGIALTELLLGDWLPKMVLSSPLKGRGLLPLPKRLTAGPARAAGDAISLPTILRAGAPATLAIPFAFRPCSSVGDTLSIHAMRRGRLGWGAERKREYTRPSCIMKVEILVAGT